MTVTRNRRRILTMTALATAVALVLILALTALNRGTGNDTAAGAVDGTSVDRIEITSTEGEPLTVPGERPTVLYFMASWCYTCIAQAQAMKELVKPRVWWRDF